VLRPDDLVEVALLPETGERTTDDDPRGRREWLLPEQIPERSAVVPRGFGRWWRPGGGRSESQPEFIF
jgi:penicillin-binding protein 1A